MTLFLAIVGILLLAIGIAGVFLPAVPGSPVMFAGMLFLGGAFGFDRLSLATWITLGVLALLMTVAEIVASMLGAKAVQASRTAVWFAGLGGVLGAFAGGLPGLLIGPFLGGMLGELLAGRDAYQSAASGAGAAIGFLSGLFMKIIIAFVMLLVFVIGIAT